MVGKTSACTTKSQSSAPCADSLPEAVDSEGRSTGVGHRRVGAVQRDGSPREMSATKGGRDAVGNRGSRWIIVMCRAACVLLASLASACSPSDEASPRPTPTSPTLPTPPTPPAFSGRLQMSGRVLDQNGAPVSGALVEVDYPAGGGSSNPPSHCPGFGFCWLVTRTNNLGEYSVEFEARPWPRDASAARHPSHPADRVLSTPFTTATKSTSSGCRPAPPPRSRTCGSVPRAAFLLARRPSSRSTPRARCAQTSRICGAWTADARLSSSSRGRAC